MSAASRPWAADLLHIWFHELRHVQRFARDDAVDAMLRRRFGRWLRALGNQPAHGFLRDPLTARAAILLFDQVPRNIHRDSPMAFAHDRLARAIERGMRTKRWHRHLPREARQFIHMPLQHSEAIADQQVSLRVFTALNDAFTLGFARAHYRMIARFGRFPHRNRVLGRASTHAERRAVAAGNAW